MPFAGRIMPSGRTMLNFVPENILRGITPTASGWDGQIGHAFQDDGGAFTDLTTAANNGTANDVALLPASPEVNDAFYFGDANIEHNQIKINIGTAGVYSGTLVWEYYNGATWVSLTVVDGTNGFKTAGTNYVTYTAPADRAKVAINGQSDYWVRVRVSAWTSITTQPLATQIWLGKAPTSLANTTDGSFTTVTGTGTVNMSASGTLGLIEFDMGATRTVLVSGRIGLYSASSSESIYIEAFSTSGQTPYAAGAIVTVTSTTEKVTQMIAKVVTGRYLVLRFVVGAASATCNVNGYQVMAYDLGE